MKSIFLFLTLLCFSLFAMEGIWTVDYTLTLDVNEPGQKTTNSFEIKITRFHNASGEFTGKALQDGKHISDVQGRIIRAESPYTQDIVKFNRLGITRPYRAEFIGFFVNNNVISNGHFVDTYGNVGEFTMQK